MRRWIWITFAYVTLVAMIGIIAVVVTWRRGSHENTIRDALNVSPLPASLQAPHCEMDTADDILFACEFRVAADDAPALLRGRDWQLVNGVFLAYATHVSRRPDRRFKLTFDASRTNAHIEVLTRSPWQSFNAGSE